MSPKQKTGHNLLLIEKVELVKGIYHGYTWGGGRLETTKLSHLNVSNFI